MKIEKLKHNPTAPSIVEFMKRALPPSLRVKGFPEGYGTQYFVVLPGLFNPARVARLDDFQSSAVVELLHPQYLSDFESLCERYERETGCRVTLRYWEASETPRESAPPQPAATEDEFPALDPAYVDTPAEAVEPVTHKRRKAHAEPVKRTVTNDGDLSYSIAIAGLSGSSTLGAQLGGSMIGGIAGAGMTTGSE